MLRDEMQDLVHTGNIWHSHADTEWIWAIVLIASIVGVYFWFESINEENDL